MVQRQIRAFEFGVKIHGFFAGERRVQCHGFRQITHLAADLGGMPVGNIFAEQGDFAFAGANQPQNELHHGGFARTVVSGQTDAFSGLQSEIDLIDGFLFAELFGYVVQNKVCRVHD